MSKTAELSFQLELERQRHESAVCELKRRVAYHAVDAMLQSESAETAEAVITSLLSCLAECGILVVGDDMYRFAQGVIADGDVRESLAQAIEDAKSWLADRAVAANDASTRWSA